MAVELMGTDMNTYTHSVNVAILSIINSIDYGYADSMCEKDRIWSFLMHDIGKTRIDNHIPTQNTKFYPTKNLNL